MFPQRLIVGKKLKSHIPFKSNWCLSAALKQLYHRRANFECVEHEISTVSFSNVKLGPTQVILFPIGHVKLVVTSQSHPNEK